MLLGMWLGRFLLFQWIVMVAMGVSQAQTTPINTSSTEILKASITETQTEADGKTILNFQEGGKKLLSFELPSEDPANLLPPAQENEFRHRRSALLKKLVLFFSRPAREASVSMVDDQRIQTLTPASDDQTTPVPLIKQSLYQRWIKPLVTSLYNLTAAEKKIFLQKKELGFSFIIQGYGVAGASKMGKGLMGGVGLDIGYDTKTNRLFVALYRTFGRFSAAASLPDAGLNLALGLRADANTAQAELIREKVLGPLQWQVVKELRGPTKTIMTGVIPYTVVVGEHNEHYSNFTGGLGLTLSPLPGLAEFDTQSVGYKVYLTNPLVLFNPLIQSLRGLSQANDLFVASKSVGLCRHVYIN